MSMPFGFGAGDNGNNFDMSNLGSALENLGRMMQNAGDGTMNWDSVRDAARQAIAAQGDPSVDEAQKRSIAAAAELADLWVNEATTFPSTGHAMGVWSRSEWVENTLSSWQTIVAPIADQVANSSAGLTAGLGGAGDLSGLDLSAMGLPADAAAQLGPMIAPLMGMMKQLGLAMFSAQLGGGLAALSAEVVGAADVGVPLTADNRPALLPRNVTEFGEGLGVAQDQVVLYLAIREIAASRLFAHVPWLRATMAGAIDEYVRGVQFDPTKLQDLMGSVDPSDPQSMQELMSSGMLEPEDTEAQRAALARLETLLALVEGWVDDVVAGAVEGRLPEAGRLQEAIRRRRAAGGPAEKTFSSLVGLELRPRRLRESALLWAALRDSGGLDARDGRWEHPDLLPTAADLDDPTGFLVGDGNWDVSELDPDNGTPSGDES